jgi:CubicO group peptidase (beta-lactamase class C family)
MSDPQVYGVCDDRFAPVRDAFEKNFRLEQDIGASFVLEIEGEKIIDLWGGHADAAKTETWQADTIVAVASSTKIPVALCGLMLLDRNLMDLDAPVSSYWPEFGQAGKDKITVRQVFDHTAALPGFTSINTVAEIYDWKKAIEDLEGQAPWWEPGTVSGYHGMTVGYLMGELVQRILGTEFKRFFIDEVTEVIDADFHLGVEQADLGRVADVVENGPRRQEPPGSLAERANRGRDEYLEIVNTEWVRTGLFPSGGGIASARGLARIGSALVGSSFNGRSLLSPSTVSQIHEEQNYFHDVISDAPTRRGLGFGLASTEVPIPFPNAFHWGGYGGSSCVMEPDRRAAWAFTPNYFVASFDVDERSARLGQATSAALLHL